MSYFKSHEFQLFEFVRSEITKQTGVIVGIWYRNNQWIYRLNSGSAWVQERHLERIQDEQP